MRGSMIKLDMRASHLLELARQFKVREWVGHASCQLISSPMQSQKLEDIERMMEKVFIVVAKARDTEIHNRTRCAFNPPPMCKVADCNRHIHCATHWAKGWLDEVACGLLHPDNPPATGEELSRIQAAKFPGVSPGCKAAMVELMVTGNYFGYRDAILKATEDSICKLYEID